MHKSSYNTIVLWGYQLAQIDRDIWSANFVDGFLNY